MPSLRQSRLTKSHELVKSPEIHQSSPLFTRSTSSLSLPPDSLSSSYTRKRASTSTFLSKKKRQRIFSETPSPVWQYARRYNPEAGELGKTRYNHHIFYCRLCVNPPTSEPPITNALRHLHQRHGIGLVSNSSTPPSNVLKDATQISIQSSMS